MTSDIPDPRSNAVCALNDAFRHAGPGRDWYCTSGVAERGLLFSAIAYRMVMTFDDFSEGNDPYGEHDFGAFTVNGVRLFWKIDCYDETLQWGSPDPSDPAVTRRTMTVLLAEDW